MAKKNYEFKLEETDYFIWCLLNQLITNDEKINKAKNELIKLLENKMFNKKEIKEDITNTELLLRFYY